MKNIDQILTDAGIEDKDAIVKAVNENYKTVAELEQKNAKLKELQESNDALTQQLNDMGEKVAAGETDAKTIEDLKGQITEFQQRQAEAEKSAAAKADAEKFANEFAEASKGFAFKNDALKATVLERARAIRSEDQVTGLSDIVSEVAQEYDAFASPQKATGTPLPKPNGNGGTITLDDVDKMSREEINRNWDAVKAALRENKG